MHRRGSGVSSQGWVSAVDRAWMTEGCEAVEGAVWARAARVASGAGRRARGDRRAGAGAGPARPRGAAAERWRWGQAPVPAVPHAPHRARGREPARYGGDAERPRGRRRGAGVGHGSSDLGGADGRHRGAVCASQEQYSRCRWAYPIGPPTGHPAHRQDTHSVTIAACQKASRQVGGVTAEGGSERPRGWPAGGPEASRRRRVGAALVGGRAREVGGGEAGAARNSR